MERVALREQSEGWGQPLPRRRCGKRGRVGGRRWKGEIAPNPRSAGVFFFSSFPSARGGGGFPPAGPAGPSRPRIPQCRAAAAEAGGEGGTGRARGAGGGRRRAGRAGGAALRAGRAGQGRASRAEQRRRRRPPCPSMSAREAVTYLPEKGLYCQRLPGRRARGAPPPPRKGKRADTMGFYGTLKMIFYKVSGRPPASPPLPAGARPRRARGQGGAGGGRGGGGPRAETCRRRGLPPGRSCSQRAAGERCQRLVAGGDAECSLLPLLFVFYIY